MFREKRSDTLVGTVERDNNVNLNARSDMELGTLLDERGFDSQTQLLKAYRGNLDVHPRRRKLFLSFHAEDLKQVQGFCLMTYSKNLDLDLDTEGLTTPIDSENSTYVKKRLRHKISAAEVVVCMIGDGTAWRDWVDWELNVATELHKGVCGIRLKESHGRRPPILAERGAPVASWGNVSDYTKAIEQAAARRS